MTEVILIEDSGNVCLQYSYPDRESVVRVTIQFEKARAFRYTTEIYCTVWQIDAYDTITQVENSTWVKELKSNCVEDMRDDWIMNHYMIYFDSSGSYEIVAEAWSIQENKTT